MRAQISIEYLIIIGLTLGILIPAIFFFYTYTKSDAGSSTSTQVNDIGLRSVSKVKESYALGAGAWQTLEFTMPQSVTQVYVTASGKELVFVYDTASGQSEAVFFSNINMLTDFSDGNISTTHPGITRYRFTAETTGVRITEAT